MELLKDYPGLETDRKSTKMIVALLIKRARRKYGAAVITTIADKVHVEPSAVRQWENTNNNKKNGKKKQVSGITAKHFIEFIPCFEESYPDILEESVDKMQRIISHTWEGKAVQNEMKGAVRESTADRNVPHQSDAEAFLEENRLRLEAQKEALDCKKRTFELEIEIGDEREQKEYWKTKCCELTAELQDVKRANQLLQERCNESESERLAEKHSHEKVMARNREKEQIAENDRRNRLHFHVLSFVAIITGILVIVLPKTVPNKSVEVFSLLVVVFATAAFEFIGIVDPNGWGDVDISLKRFMRRKKRGEVR